MPGRIETEVECQTVVERVVGPIAAAFRIVHCVAVVRIAKAGGGQEDGAGSLHDAPSFEGEDIDLIEIGGEEIEFLGCDPFIGKEDESADGIVAGTDDRIGAEVACIGAEIEQIVPLAGRECAPEVGAVATVGDGVGSPVGEGVDGIVVGIGGDEGRIISGAVSEKVDAAVVRGADAAVGGTDGLELLVREGPDAGGGLIAEVASGELYLAGIGNGEESASDGAIGGEDRFGGAGGFACKEEGGAAECGEGAEE